MYKCMTSIYISIAPSNSSGTFASGVFSPLLGGSVTMCGTWCFTTLLSWSAINLKLYLTNFYILISWILKFWFFQTLIAFSYHFKFVSFTFFSKIIYLDIPSETEKITVLGLQLPRNYYSQHFFKITLFKDAFQ